MILAILCLLALAFSFTPLWCVSIVILSGFVLLFLNRQVLGITNKMASFSAKREIKHYRTLVIGDFCPIGTLSAHVENWNETLALTIPGRSLEASYRILLHTVSILDEGATCIVVWGGREPKKPYTVFDIPYFSLVTLKELGLAGWERKARFPLFYEFRKSLCLLLKNTSGTHYVKVACPDERISSFCMKKDIRLITLVRQYGK